VTHDPVLASYANRRIVLRDGLVLSDDMNTGVEASALAVGGGER
jgi:putative ABC transport system ATP-binding protein